MKTSKITVSISRNIPEDDRESLLLVLHTKAELQEVTERGLDPESWRTIVAILTTAGAAANSIKAVIDLIAAIKKWRADVRERKISPKVRLSHGSLKTVDLESATDDELDAFGKDLAGISDASTSDDPVER